MWQIFHMWLARVDDNWQQKVKFEMRMMEEGAESEYDPDAHDEVTPESEVTPDHHMDIDTEDQMDKYVMAHAFVHLWKLSDMDGLVDIAQ